MESDLVRSRFVCPVNFQVNAPRTFRLKPVFLKNLEVSVESKPLDARKHIAARLAAASKPPFFDVSSATSGTVDNTPCTHRGEGRT